MTLGHGHGLWAAHRNRPSLRPSFGFAVPHGKPSVLPRGVPTQQGGPLGWLAPVRISGMGPKGPRSPAMTWGP